MYYVVCVCVCVCVCVWCVHVRVHVYGFHCILTYNVPVTLDEVTCGEAKEGCVVTQSSPFTYRHHTLSHTQTQPHSSLHFVLEVFLLFSLFPVFSQYLLPLSPRIGHTLLLLSQLKLLNQVLLSFTSARKEKGVGLPGPNIIVHEGVKTFALVSRCVSTCLPTFAISRACCASLHMLSRSPSSLHLSLIAL